MLNMELCLVEIQRATSGTGGRGCCGRVCGRNGRPSLSKTKVFVKFVGFAPIS